VKINLPVKLLYPALAAAALLSAANGLFAASYNSYTQCRCSQPNEPGTNYSLTTCCGDQYYKAANPSKCTDCSAYVCSRAAGGGKVLEGTDSGTAACNTCCGGTGNRPGPGGSCGGNNYVACVCPCTVQGWTDCSPSNASACFTDNWSDSTNPATTAQTSVLTTALGAIYYDLKFDSTRISNYQTASSLGTGGAAGADACCQRLWQSGVVPNCTSSLGTAVNGRTFDPAESYFADVKCCAVFGSIGTSSVITMCYNNVGASSTFHSWAFQKGVFLYQKYTCQ